MDVQVGDVLTMKKAHPCGENHFVVLRVGMDFKIKCMGCGRKSCRPAKRWRRASGALSALREPNPSGQVPPPAKNRLRRP